MIPIHFPRKPYKHMGLNEVDKSIKKIQPCSQRNSLTLKITNNAGK